MNGISIIVPVYNEEHEVHKVLDKLKKLWSGNETPCEIIVVDDASTDSTPAVLSRITGIKLLKNPQNSGYGASLKNGLRHAAYDTVGIIDSDNTYPVEELPVMLGLMKEYDMVVGRRKQIIYPHFNLLKRMGRISFDLLCSYLVNHWIPDINSGLRIFKKDIALSHMDELCERFSFTTSLTLIMFSNGHRVIYRDVDYCKEPIERASKVKIVRDGFKTLSIILTLGIKYHPLKIAFLLLAAACACAGLGVLI